MAAGDMQQRNVTAADAAAADALDPLTGEFLEPTDNKKQCADNYGTGFAPVNPAITQLKKLVAGLRGSIRGDFAGAVQRSVKSLLVDLTGGTTHTTTPGTAVISGTGANNVVSLRLLTGALRAAGDLITDVGNVVVNMGSVFTNMGNFQTQAGNFLADSSESTVNMGSSGERSFLTSRKVQFTGVSSLFTGSNPPQGTTMRNELRAINIPKVSGLIRFNMGTLTIVPGSGYGLGSVNLHGATPFAFDVLFTDNFANTNYVMTWSSPGLLTVNEYFTSREVNRMVIQLTSLATGTYIDLSTYVGYVNIKVDGMQVS